MSDETKVWLGFLGLATVFLIGAGVLIYASERDKATLRQAACVAPESVACALAVRQ